MAYKCCVLQFKSNYSSEEKKNGEKYVDRFLLEVEERIKVH